MSPAADLIAYDWRAAARATEQSTELQPIDIALTFTGLAYELCGGDP